MTAVQPRRQPRCRAAGRCGHPSLAVPARLRSDPARPLRLGIRPGHVLCCSGRWPCHNNPAAPPGIPVCVSGSHPWVRSGRAGAQRGAPAVRPAAVGLGWPLRRALPGAVPSSCTPLPCIRLPGWLRGVGELCRDGAGCGVPVLLSPSPRDIDLRAEEAVAEGEDGRGARRSRHPPALLLVRSAIPRGRGSPFICEL